MVLFINPAHTRLNSRLSHDSFYHVLVRQWLFWSFGRFCKWFPSQQGFQKNKVPAAFPDRLRAHLWSRLLVGAQLNLSAIFFNLPIANFIFIFRNRVAIDLRTDKDTWTSLCKHDKLYRNNLYKQAYTHTVCTYSHGTEPCERTYSVYRDM